MPRKKTRGSGGSAQPSAHAAAAATSLWTGREYVARGAGVGDTPIADNAEPPVLTFAECKKKLAVATTTGCRSRGVIAGLRVSDKKVRVKFHAPNCGGKEVVDHRTREQRSEYGIWMAAKLLLVL